MKRCRATLAISLLALMLAGCGNRTNRAGTRSDEGARRYSLHGQIIRFERSGKVVVIRHERIDDWMDAMIMAFPLGDPHVASSLHTGDQVEAAVFVKDQDYWIGEIHHVLAR